MSIRTVELHKAVYTALNTGDYTVMDSPPDEPILPLITLGDVFVTEDDTKTSRRSTHLVTINTWSKGHSKLEVYQMNEFVEQAIRYGTLSVTGFNVDRVSTELIQILRDADYTGAVHTDIDGIVYHGVLQFNITLSSL